MPEPRLLAQCLEPSTEGATIPLCEHLFEYVGATYLHQCLGWSALCWCTDALDTGSSLSWKLLIDIYHTLPGNVITGSIFHPIPSKNESKTEEKVGIDFLKNCYKGRTLWSHPHILCSLICYQIKGLQPQQHLRIRVPTTQVGPQTSLIHVYGVERKLSFWEKYVQVPAGPGKAGKGKMNHGVLSWNLLPISQTQAGSTTIGQLYMAPTVYNRQTKTDKAHTTSKLNTAHHLEAPWISTWNTIA